jgi:GTPase SAR1 family protein
MARSGPVADETVKLVIMGKGSVSKCSLITRFREDGFQENHKQMRGVLGCMA